MRCDRLVLLSLLILASLPAAGAQAAHSTAVRPPQFDEYPAGALFVGHRHPLIVSKENRFRTQLLRGAKGKVNFAGHYVFTAWGCGAECIMAAAIDVKTGKFFLVPFTVCCWGAGNEPAEFHVDSRLIVLQGARNEMRPGTWYYQIDDREGWVVVREVPRPPLGQG